MPELPEVETITNGIKSVLLNSNITTFKFYRDNLRDKFPKAELKKAFEKNTVTDIYRRSKYIIIKSSKGYCLIHLGMTGNLLLFDSPKPSINHTHVVIGFRDKKNKMGYLHYVDPRRFGRFAFCNKDDIENHILLKNLGPEPLECNDLGKHLFDVSRNKKTTIKGFVMDAKNVVGVGNIYASESLFTSGINPEVKAGELSLKHFQLLSKEIKKTLKKAIKAGGTTLKDFKTTKGEPGYFAISLNVYGRKGEPCKVCQTPIESIRIAGRSTFYCSNCQS